ncbi:MAG: hypothetical protein KIS88_02325 [Anaerolineales bacterium]|nr:hypothetical protein [Anaerolineales bacterium]
MLTQVSHWLELKWWQLAVQALSATRTLGSTRAAGNRVLRAAAEAAQRATERSHSRQAQQALHAEYVAADLYSPDVQAPHNVWQHISENWTFVALAGWVLGLAVGLWLAGVLW